MLLTPPEFNPYQTILNLLLFEAVETDTEQILMISRTDEASLYFVSNGHVKRAMPLQKACALGLLELCSLTKKPIFLAKHRGHCFAIEVKLIHKGFGECLLLAIREIKQVYAGC